MLIDTQMTDTLNTTTTAATLHRGWQTCSSFLILHITNVQIGSHNFPGRLGVCSQGHGPPLLSGIWDPYENATNGNDKNSHALLKAEAIFSHHTPKKYQLNLVLSRTYPQKFNNEFAGSFPKSSAASGILAIYIFRYYLDPYPYYPNIVNVDVESLLSPLMA